MNIQTLKKRFGIWSMAAFLACGPILASAGALPEAAAAASANERTASVFTDTAGHWGAETIQWAVTKGIVDGYADGTFKPDRLVTEAEFLAMLLRAYPDTPVPAGDPSLLWYIPYYSFAYGFYWPVDQGKADAPYVRGQVARLLAASQGLELDVPGAVQYLLDGSLAEGKTSRTLEGFAAGDTPTRAEAVQFIQNLTAKKTALAGLPAPARAIAVRGVSLGDSAAAVTAKLGAPDRVDASEYGFEWHIYNRDYASYVQVGIQNGKVAALYTNSSAWTSSRSGIRPGATAGDIVSVLGKPLESLMKGNTRYLLHAPGEGDGLYEMDGSYVTFFYDTHEGKTVDAIQLIAKEAEEARSDMYGTPDAALRAAFERQAFDLANAARAKRGLPPFQWSDQAAETARKHSEDMAVYDYFDHTNAAGQSPFDRMKADGIVYSLAAENIAAGQTNAISAHSGWMNSTSGHREAILGGTTQLGVGVYLGGPMHAYYTQNFFTPMKK